jgi:hypothetical protein
VFCCGHIILIHLNVAFSEIRGLNLRIVMEIHITIIIIII